MSHPRLPASAYAALGLSPATLKLLMTPKPAPASIAAPNLLESDEDSAQAARPNETLISLYAELLLRVRTVTLYASLRTHHERETTAKLSADGAMIAVEHEGTRAVIRLPIKVKGTGDASLDLPAEPPTKEITMRLQIEEQEGSELLYGVWDEGYGVNVVPWDGAGLEMMGAGRGSVQVRCVKCEGVVVGLGSVREWRDLPSENWAEMMDFWHCHKPDEEHLHEDGREDVMGKKGYAAGNRLRAVAGVGYIDLTSFLLTVEDCEGAEVPDDPAQRFVSCRHCKGILGQQEHALDGWRVWKWRVSITSPSLPSTIPNSYSTQKWIAARLLHLIENSAIRKFHIHTPPLASASSSPDQEPTQRTPSLLIWVFTPDLLFSSSTFSPSRHDPTRALKLFYKRQTWAPLQPGEVESASVEDVDFPSDLYESLEQALQESQGLLPVTARKFKDWEVGLLRRFDGVDVGPWRGREDEGEGEQGLSGSAEEDWKEPYTREGTVGEDSEGKPDGTADARNSSM